MEIVENSLYDNLIIPGKPPIRFRLPADALLKEERPEILPRGCVFSGKQKGTSLYVVEVLPHMRHIKAAAKFADKSTEKTYLCSLPFIYFFFQFDGPTELDGKKLFPMSSVRVFAGPEPYTFGCTLYHAPFSNVYADGNICFGTSRSATGESVRDTVAAVIDQFFMSRFNGDLLSNLFDWWDERNSSGCHSYYAEWSRRSLENRMFWKNSLIEYCYSDLLYAGDELCKKFSSNPLDSVIKIVRIFSKETQKLARRLTSANLEIDEVGGDALILLLYEKVDGISNCSCYYNDALLHESSSDSTIEKTKRYLSCAISSSSHLDSFFTAGYLAIVRGLASNPDSDALQKVFKLMSADPWLMMLCALKLEGVTVCLKANDGNEYGITAIEKIIAEIDAAISSIREKQELGHKPDSADLQEVVPGAAAADDDDDDEVAGDTLAEIHRLIDGRNGDPAGIADAALVGDPARPENDEEVLA